MAIEYERFERSRRDDEQARTIAMVDALATQLRGELEANAASIDVAHIHGASSSAVQEIVSAILKEHLGFDEEVVLTHEDGILARPRPDFFFRLGPCEGVPWLGDLGLEVAYHRQQHLVYGRLGPEDIVR